MKIIPVKDLAHIDFVEYLKSLVDMLLGFYREKSNNIDVSLKCGEINLEIDTAISMGLIVNELLSNCLNMHFQDKIVVKCQLPFSEWEKLFTRSC